MADVVKESQKRHDQWLADRAAAAEEEKAAAIRASAEKRRQRPARGVAYDPSAAGAQQRERLNESIRAQDAARAEAEAAASAGPTAMDPGSAAQERGKRDFAAGMGLVAEADRTVAVTRARPTYGAVKAYTDTMGHGARREGRFVGARPQGQVAGEVAPTAPAQAPAPVQVVVQTPQAAPAAQPAAPAPSSSSTPVPAGARPRGGPGMPAASTPSTPIPLEGDPEVVAADQAALDEQLAAMSPAQQAEWLRKESERLDQQSARTPAVPAAAVSRGAPGAELDKGVLQRELNAAEDVSQAKVDLAQAEADLMTESAAQYQAALDEQRAAEATEAARVEAQLEERKKADQQIDAATRAFGEAQTLSPQTAWKNMGAGRRVAFAINALTAGLRGAADPLAAVKAAVQSEVDAQEAVITKLGSNLDAARARGDSAASVYESVLQEVGDARQARSITEVARLNQIKADFEAGLARENVKVLSAEQEAFLTGLEEEIAGKQMAIDVQTVRNTRTITTAAHVYSKGQRAAMKAGGKLMMESGVKGIEGGEEWRGKAVLQDQELDAKAALEREKQAMEKEKDAYDNLGGFADKTEVAQQTVGLIDKLLAQDDIAGYGLTAGPTVGNAANNVEADIKAIAESFGRLQSQGVISPTEEERFMAMLTDGTTLGGEKRLRQNLQRIKGMVILRITAQERRLSPEARAAYNRNKANPELAPRWSGGSGQPVVKVDE